MKKTKIHSGLTTNMKINQINNKNNTSSNQITNLNKPQCKISNNSVCQILLKFKTQKNSPHKTPPKSLNKIYADKNLKNVFINTNLNKNFS